MNTKHKEQSQALPLLLHSISTQYSTHLYTDNGHANTNIILMKATCFNQLKKSLKTTKKLI